MYSVIRSIDEETEMREAVHILVGSLEACLYNKWVEQLGLPHARVTLDAVENVCAAVSKGRLISSMMDLTLRENPCPSNVDVEHRKSTRSSRSDTGPKVMRPRGTSGRPHNLHRHRKLPLLSAFLAHLTIGAGMFGLSPNTFGEDALSATTDDAARFHRYDAADLVFQRSELRGTKVNVEAVVVCETASECSLKEPRPLSDIVEVDLERLTPSDRRRVILRENSEWCPPIHLTGFFDGFLLAVDNIEIGPDQACDELDEGDLRSFRSN